MAALVSTTSHIPQAARHNHANELVSYVICQQLFGRHRHGSSKRT